MRRQVARFYKTRRAAAAALIALAAAAATGCSSAPKPPDAVFVVANQGAEYAKLAEAQLAQGKLEESLRLYEEARRAYSSVDDLRGVASTRAALGRAWLAAGKLEEAEREFGLALDYARMAGGGDAASAALSGLGELAWRRGEAAEALRLFSEAASLAGKDSAALAVALHDSATVQAATGAVAEAKAGLARSAAINLRLKRWTELASDRYVLASILAKEGDLEGALREADAALDADRRAENGRGLVLDLAASARILQRLGREAEAYGRWRRSFDAALAVDDAAGVRKALEALLPLAAALGKTGDEAYWKDLLGRLDAAGRAISAAGALGAQATPAAPAPAEPASTAAPSP